MLPLTITFATLILATIALPILVRVERRRVLNSLGNEVKGIENELTALDSAISKGLARATELLPFSEMVEARKTLNDVTSDLNYQRENIKVLEEKLSALQARVAKEEEQQSEVKRGKERSEQLADDVLAKTEQLTSELNRLQDELDRYKTEMQMLASELEMTEAQAAALQQVMNSLNMTKNEVASIKSTYDEAVERFTRLVTQHSELEKEYRKLVDRELAEG